MSVLVKLPDSGSSKFEAEIVTLPAIVKIPASKGERLSGIIVGLFFSIFGLSLFLQTAGQTSFQPNIFVGLALGCFGGYHIAKALFSPKGETTLKFDEYHVKVTIKAWLGEKTWEEPLRHFKGVKLREQKHKTKSGKANYQIIELIHKDNTKTLPLYASRHKIPPIDHLEHYADILDVKILNEKEFETTGEE